MTATGVADRGEVLVDQLGGILHLANQPHAQFKGGLNRLLNVSRFDPNWLTHGNRASCRLNVCLVRDPSSMDKEVPILVQVPDKIGVHSGS